MKHFLILILVLSTFLGKSVVAQDMIKEATVTYDVDLIGPAAEDPKYKMLFGDGKMTISFNEENAKMLMDFGMIKNVIHVNGESDPAVLMNIMGMKYILDVNAKDLAEKKKTAEGVVFEKVKETKKIAGYACTKVIAKTEDGNSFPIYTTDKISSNATGILAEYAKLGSFPLQFETVLNNLRFKITANNVSLDKVEKDIFVVPTDHTSITLEELLKMSQGF